MSRRGFLKRLEKVRVGVSISSISCLTSHRAYDGDDNDGANHDNDDVDANNHDDHNEEDDEKRR